ncbi:MAG: hypothetical protein HY719_01255 [Planctomycetes bacterium]|nr:hypothetical protein [Planctomycetota bacterium]
MDVNERLRRAVQKNGRYPLDAYYFLYDALDYTVGVGGKVAHVTAKELLAGVRDLAAATFGYLAPTVFAGWRIRSGSDFGEMVYLLIREGLMQRNDEDHRADFDDVIPSFDAAFTEHFQAHRDRVRLAPNADESATGADAGAGAGPVDVADAPDPGEQTDDPS